MSPEQWQRYIAANGLETPANILRTVHPTALNPAEQREFFRVGTLWVFYVGPLPQAPPSKRQVKRAKDKAKQKLCEEQGKDVTLKDLMEQCKSMVADMDA